MSQLLVRRVFVCQNVLRQAIRVPKNHNSNLTEEAAKFFAKHKAKGNPMSPFIHYQPQLTWLLSITHRCTGLGLGILLYGYGVTILSSPHKNFEQLMKATRENFPAWFLTTVKFLCASSVAFHTFNGVRHLAWDLGYGFKLKSLYASGYTVLGLTLLSIAFILANQ